MHRTDRSPPRGGVLPSGEAVFLQLIRDAKGGDHAALEQLLAQCRPYLLAIANGELDEDLHAKVGASDIVQNSMLSAQRCIGEFQGESRQQLFAWLRGILLKDLRQTHRHYRAGKRHVGRESPLRDDSFSDEGSRFVDSTDSPSTAAADREEEERLYRALESLGCDERQVIELRNWQRLSFAQIGDRMNRSSEAARKLWSRAIVRLQKQMDRIDA